MKTVSKAPKTATKRSGMNVVHMKQVCSKVTTSLRKPVHRPFLQRCLATDSRCINCSQILGHLAGDLIEWVRVVALHIRPDEGSKLGFLLAYSQGLGTSPFFIALISATVFSQFSLPP
jgi:hypothetical protein